MIEFNLIYFLFFLLVVLQSIAGVGVLVIGTPMLLLFNFNLVEILSILLPISIITSLLNLILFKLNKKNLNIKIDKEIKILFFLICLPFIFIGLYLLKSLENGDDKITETNYVPSDMITKIRNEMEWCHTKIGVESYRNYIWPTTISFIRKKM